MTCHHLLCQFTNPLLISFQLFHLLFQLLHIELFLHMLQSRDIYMIHILKNGCGDSFLHYFDLTLILSCSRFPSLHFSYQGILLVFKKSLNQVCLSGSSSCDYLVHLGLCFCYCGLQIFGLSLVFLHLLLQFVYMFS